jgi:uncharacterized protein DUF6879
MKPLIPPGGPEFIGLFRTFQYSVFRLETLQSYAASGEDEQIEAFLTGRPEPASQEKQSWVELIRAGVAAGKTIQRVHVVCEPLSPYLAFELTWAYAPNVAAGEDIRIIPVRGSWPADVPRYGYDFWLFDSSRLYQNHYTEDGTWLGAELLANPSAVVDACYARDAALHSGVPLA